MRKIQVMLSSRPKLFSEVLYNLLKKQKDMEVVSDVIDPILLLFAARTIPVDVVIITPQKTNGEPRICSKLLSEHPALLIITLSGNSEDVFIYKSGIGKKRINESSGQSILTVIRESMRIITG